MRITFLPSALGTGEASQYLTSYLVNDAIAIDAGSLGFWKSPEDQAAIRHVFISHTHIDHVASLPIFLENVASFHDTPVRLYASDVVLESMRTDLFNGRIWANFLELTHERGRFVNLVPIAEGQTLEVEGLRITCVGVNHVVPTMGFLIEDANSGVVIVSDTGPTEKIWKRASAMANLNAVFLESTFPDEMASLAELTKHLTPAGFLGEMRKLTRPATFYAVHLRARCRDDVAQQLLAHRLPNLEITSFGKTYTF